MCALDFNQYDEQRESLGAIPSGSMVKVRMTIRQPKVPGSDPALSLSKKGDSEYLDCEFEVLAGTYATRKIWNNFTIGGVTEGQKKAGQISGRTFRSIVEAVRGISPKDHSPTACQGRFLNQWFDLNGLEFGVVVDVEKPQAGDKYVNNTIKRVITVDEEAYAHIMAGGEFITDTPLPEIPQGSQSAAPGWAAPKVATAAPAAPAQGSFPAAPPVAPSAAAPRAPYVAPPTAARPPQASPQQPAGSMPPPPPGGGMPGWAAAPQSGDVPF